MPTGAAATSPAQLPASIDDEETFRLVEEKETFLWTENGPGRAPSSWQFSQERLVCAALRCPEQDAGLWTRITFRWLNALLELGKIKPLELDDLWSLPSVDDPTRISARFQETWKRRCERHQYRPRARDHSQGRATREAPHVPHPRGICGLFSQLRLWILHRSGVAMSPTDPEEEQTNHEAFLASPHTVAKSPRPLSVSTECREDVVPKRPEQGLGAVVLALLDAFGGRCLGSAPLKLCYDLLNFVGPLALERMLQFLSRGAHEESSLEGMLCVLALFTAPMLQSICLHQYFHMNYRVGMQARAALMDAIYRKTLRLSVCARNHYGAGDIVNLLAVDTQRATVDLTPYLHIIWSGPLQIIIAMVCLYRVVGMAAFAGFLFMAALIPLNGWVARLIGQQSRALMERKDERIRLLHEILSGIRQIKIMGWEQAFFERVQEARLRETQVLRRKQLLEAFSNFSWAAAPVATALVTFGCMGVGPSAQRLTPATAFGALTLFNILRFPLSVFPDVLSSLMDAAVSLRRIQAFLCHYEVPERFALDAVETDSASSGTEVSETLAGRPSVARKATSSFLGGGPANGLDRVANSQSASKAAAADVTHFPVAGTETMRSTDAPAEASLFIDAGSAATRETPGSELLRVPSLPFLSDTSAARSTSLQEHQESRLHQRQTTASRLLPPYGTSFRAGHWNEATPAMEAPGDDVVISLRHMSYAFEPLPMQLDASLLLGVPSVHSSASGQSSMGESSLLVPRHELAASIQNLDAVSCSFGAKHNDVDRSTYQGSVVQGVHGGLVPDDKAVDQTTASVHLGQTFRNAAACDPDMDAIMDMDTDTNTGAGPFATNQAGTVPSRKNALKNTPEMTEASPGQGTLSWVLHDITLQIQRGQLVLICGEVGSGKSSLLLAILGELYGYPATVEAAMSTTFEAKTTRSFASSYQGAHHLVRPTTIGYCPQEAYLMNASLRENILFYTPLDEQRYREVLEATALVDDLAQMPAGDRTEIGSKGINLSGGQKARVALARALYSCASLLLLDDPLSAVDATVGRVLFERALCGPLARGRTRILVTHHRQWLSRADLVIELAGGRIQRHSVRPQPLRIPRGKPRDQQASPIQVSLLSDAENDEKQLLASGDKAGAFRVPTSRAAEPLVMEHSNELEVSGSFPLGTIDATAGAGRGAPEDALAAEHAVGDLPLSEVSIAQSSRPGIEQGATPHAKGNAFDQFADNNDNDKYALRSRATYAVASNHGSPADGAAPSADPESMPEAPGTTSHQLVTAENRETGSVKRTVYLAYFAAAGRFLLAVTILASVLAQVFRIGTDSWLGIWSEAGSRAATSAAQRTGADKRNPSTPSGLPTGAPGLGHVPEMPPGVRTRIQNLMTPSGSHLAAEEHQVVSVLTPDQEQRGWQQYQQHRSCADALTSRYLQGRSWKQSIFWGFPNRPSRERAAETSRSDSQRVLHATSFYLGIYALLNLSTLLMLLARSILAALSTLSAAIGLHTRLLQVVLRAPTMFFDTTPVGRILNRFSKDQDALDEDLPYALLSFLNCILQVLGVVWVTSTVTPVMLLVLIPTGILYYRLSRYYLCTSRELKRLEALSKSPILARMGETAAGIPVIRAFGLVREHVQVFLEAVADHMRPYLYSVACNRWLSFRLEMLSAMTVFATALAVFLFRRSLSPAAAGLSITYSLLVTQTLSWLVRMTTEVENGMSAVERILWEIPSEAPAYIEGSLPAHWPSEGRVEFRDVWMRYRPELPPALRGVSFTILPGQRVGLIGRTGAGKSSIAQVLFRTVGDPLQAGAVIVDGIDISRVGVAQLRERLAMVTQDTILFRGTLRENLDPFHRHTDAELWQALRYVSLAENDTHSAWAAVDRTATKTAVAGCRHGDTSAHTKTGTDAAVNAADAVAEHGTLAAHGASTAALKQQEEQARSMPALKSSNRFPSLDTHIAEGGSNLSAGQRQLLCLARVLLRRPRVLVLDESTANLDYRTDRAIQRTIRACLQGSTLLIIAHRMDTILDCDLIIGLAAGRVVECGSPASLLQRRDSLFYQLAWEQGVLEQITSGTLS